MRDTDAFKVLEVPHSASKAEIRKAYRTLAKRWHPDRFAEGPERDWANEKMAMINAAYQECLHGPKGLRSELDDRTVLDSARLMISEGRYRKARESLMTLSTRCAEWNYLFGLTLLNLHETEKAKLYLRIAAHQKPDEKLYAQAYARANAVSRMSLIDRILGKKTR